MLDSRQRAQAKRHIEKLAKEHHIGVHYTKAWRTAECEHSTRQVFLPARIRTGTDYLASLHEIGHLVDPVALDASDWDSSHRSNRLYRQTIEEAAAWAWAIRSARPTLLRACSARDWANVGWCWTSHAARS